MANEQDLNLFIRLKDEASAQLKKIDASLKTSGKAWQQNYSEVTRLARTAGIAMTAFGGAVAASLGVAIKQTVQFGSEMKDMAGRTGMSVEALSKLRYAAEQSGATLGDIEVSTKRLSSVMQDAGRGTKTAEDAFRAIGLTLNDLKNLKPEDQFINVAQAVGRIPDPMQRSAAALDLFGRSGTSLLPMLADGEEGLEALMQQAEDLGLVMSGDAVDAADEFGDSLDNLKSSMAGLLRSGTAPLMESLKPAVDDFAKMAAAVSKWAKANPEAAATAGKVALAVAGISMAIGGALLVIPKLISGYASLKLAIAGLDAAAIGAAKNFGVLGIAVAGVLGWASAFKSFADNWDTFKTMPSGFQMLLNIMKGKGPLGIETISLAPGVAEKAEIGRRKLEELKKSVNDVNKAFKEVDMATEEAKTAWASLTSAISSLMATQKNRIQSTYQAAVDAINKERDAARKAYDERIRQIDSQLSAQLSALSLYYGAQSDALQGQIDALQATLDAEDEAERKANQESARQNLLAQIHEIGDRENLTEDEKKRLAELERAYRDLVNEQIRDDRKEAIRGQQETLRKQMEAIRKQAEQEMQQERDKSDRQKELAQSNLEFQLAALETRATAAEDAYDQEILDIARAEQYFTTAEEAKTAALIAELTDRFAQTKQYVDMINALPPAVVRQYIQEPGSSNLPTPNPAPGTTGGGSIGWGKPDFTVPVVPITPNPGTIGSSPEAMGAVNVNVTVQGSVQAERDLAATIREEFLRIKDRTGNLGFA